MSHPAAHVPPSSPALPLPLGRVVRYALVNLGQELSLAELSRAGGLSTASLQRQFSQHLGCSPMRWLWQRRVLAAAAMLLRQPQSPLHVVAYSCGFLSLAHFSRRFVAEFHKTATDYRRCHGQAAEFLPSTLPCAAAQLLAQEPT